MPTAYLGGSHRSLVGAPVPRADPAPSTLRTIVPESPGSTHSAEPPACRALPAELTLLAPRSLPYAALLGALVAARERGVRRALVVVEERGTRDGGTRDASAPAVADTGPGTHTDTRTGG